MPSAVTRSAWKAFLLLDRLGVHVLPKHYYTPIPDYRWLRQHPEAWMGRAPLLGVSWNLDKQVSWLSYICSAYYHEVAGLDSYQQITRQAAGPGFGPIESQILHCFIRSQAPPRILEIGSGVSTLCMLHALDINQRESRPRSELVCIEPYPRRPCVRIRTFLSSSNPAS